MKSLGISLLVLGLALTAVGASAQGGQTAFTLVADNTGGFAWKDVDGAKNPTLTVPASTEVTITIKVADDDMAGIPHNIKVGTGATSGNIAEAGDSLEYKFTSPATGSVNYICAIHPGTMKGTVSVAGSGNAETKDSPSLALVGGLLALAGAALVLRRRA